MKNSQKTRATTPGSFNDLQDKIRAAVNQKYSQDPTTGTDELYPFEIIPDVPVIAGKTIIENYKDDKYYITPFTVDSDNEITLKEATEVQMNVTYDPVIKGMFVFKDEAKREVTSPVMLPGCADCDFKRGEKIFTEDEVSAFCNAYDTHFRLADQMHIFGATGQIVGQSIKNWTLAEEETHTNVLGDTVTLPRGTWMTTIKITDDTTWQQIENGTFKGCSGTYIPRVNAEKLLEELTANKIDFSYNLDVFESAIKRVLIKDLEDPVPVTISLVDRPCVPNAIFTSVKTCPTASEKAGRSISNSTLATLNKAYEKAANSLENLKSLIEKAAGERPADKSKTEVNDMDEKELAEIVGKIFDEKIKPVTEKIEAVEKKLPDEDTGGTAIKCDKCEHELVEADKFCPDCGDKIESEPGKEDPAIKELEDKIKGLEEQVNKSNDLSTNPSKNSETASKRDDSGIPKKLTI